MNNQPIGILDSGVGGLSIWKEIIRELPNESTIYLADSINCPYGVKSEEEIYHLAKQLVRFLIEQKVKLIVVACNTITVACIDKLRQYLLRRHSGESRQRSGRLQNPQKRFWTSQNDETSLIPIVGLVPAVKTAAEVSKNKRIGILSTPITAESEYQKQLIEKFAKGCIVVNIGTEELVPFIERGEIDSKSLRKILQKILNEFIVKDVDTIVFGCSHFPFLKNTVEEIMGGNVKILDSGEAIARQVRRVLTHNNNLSLSNNQSYLFYTTGNVVEFTKVAKKLVGEKFRDLIKSVQYISL